jgi:putative drug exporter of the RND superfamily
MIFERIANGVTKHYKMIVIVWIIALLLAVPAMLQVNSAVQYESDFGTGDGYESLQANKVISEQFQGTEANGTLLVLLQSDDITDSASRDFVLDLEKRIAGSPDLEYLQGTS